MELHGKLKNSIVCVEEFDVLIEIIESHNEKYNFVTNNCKDFAREIINRMISNRS